MKKICFILAIFVVFTMFLPACASKTADLYDKGLEVVSVMEEMLNSREYGEIMGAPDLFKDLIVSVAETDFSYPAVVYKLSLPSTEVLIKKAGLADASLYSKLSDDLKEQIENRMNFATVASVINGTQGNEKLAFASLFSAIVNDKSIECEKPITYLYIYENGICVGVSFKNGTAQGNFVFLDDFSPETYMGDIFGSIGIEYSVIK